MQPQTICIKCVIRSGLFLYLCKTNEISYCYFIDKTRCDGVVPFPVEYFSTGIDILSLAFFKSVAVHLILNAS